MRLLRSSLLAIAVLALCAGLGYAFMLQSTVCGTGGSVSGCNPANDEVGSRSTGGSAQAFSNGYVYCNYATADCTGTLGKAYIWNGNADDDVKVGIFTAASSAPPDINDTVIAWSGEITSTDGAESWWASSTDLGGSVTSGSGYYICIITSTDNWAGNYDAGSTLYYNAVETGHSYASPPDTLYADEDGWSSTADRKIEVYVEIK
jgi:hypothetical protein